MPNVHVFPLVAYPGPAPELAARSGQGNWDAYALPAPADRLLPFVLTRLVVPGQARWINCATIVDADTLDVLETLTPTGPTAGAPPTLGMVLDKLPDPAQGVEHFVYYGALIPGLSLPCGRPLRLLLDNGWQSPRFYAYPSLAGFQKLEWTHPGPMTGVPYGSGFVQRLYVENGGLQYTAPREVQTSVQDAVSGVLRVDFTAEYARRTATAGPYPVYLLDALSSARAHKFFTVDAEPWKLVEVKDASTGTDGGRAVMTLTVEALTPVQARNACVPAPLAALVYDPVADAPRGWRCGDTSDVAPDFQPTGSFACVTNSDGNTGMVTETTRDLNPNSPTYNQTSTRAAGMDTGRCPLPFPSAAISEEVTRADCAPGLVPGSVTYTLAAGYFRRPTQVAADAAARAYFDAHKQAYANANATCMNRQVTVVVTEQPGGAWLATFTRTDSDGPLLIDFSVDRDDGQGNATTYTSAITIADGQTVATRVIAPPAATYAECTITATTPSNYTIV